MMNSTMYYVHIVTKNLQEIITCVYLRNVRVFMCLTKICYKQVFSDEKITWVCIHVLNTLININMKYTTIEKNVHLTAVFLSSRGGHQTHDLVQGEDTCTAWAVFGQHLVDSHEQAKPDPNHAESIQTRISQCPSCDPGHMTSVKCRIRTIDN